MALALPAQDHRTTESTARAASLLGYGNWCVQTVDQGEGDSSFFGYSIATSSGLASTGTHVAYIRADQWQSQNATLTLMHATDSSGSWQSESVCEIEDYYSSSRIVASDGPPRIGLMNRTGVYLFVNTSGSWVRTVVDGGPAEHLTMILDNQGALKFFYSKNRTAFEAAVAQSGWNAISIYTAPDNWSTPWGPVALDAEGHLHTAVQTAEGLLHLSNESGTWTTEMVDLGSEARNIDICTAGPPANATVISYSDEKEGNTKVASDTHGFWELKILSEESQGLSSALISYQSGWDDLTIQNLRLAYTGRSDGGYYGLKVWTADVGMGGVIIGSLAVDEDTNWGDLTAIAAKGEFSHVLYYDMMDRTLRYATDSVRVPHVVYQSELEPGYHSATLRWTWWDNSGETPAKSFKIYKSWSDEQVIVTEVVTIRARYHPDASGYSNVEYSYTDRGLRSDTWYRYTVSAVNEVGESIQSPIQSVQPSSHVSTLFIEFLAAFIAAILLAVVVIYQNRKRILGIKPKIVKMAPQTYHTPRVYEKKEPGEIDEEELIDGHPKHLKKM